MSLFKRKITICQTRQDLVLDRQKLGQSTKNLKRQFLSVMTSRTRISYNEQQSEQLLISRLKAQSIRKSEQNESFWLNPCEKAQNICENDVVFHERQENFQSEINLPTRNTHDLKAKQNKQFNSKPCTPVNKLKESQFLVKRLPMESVQISRVQLFNQLQMKILLNH